MDVDAMDIGSDDTFDRVSEAFIGWTSNNGITLSQKIKIADHRQQGSGRAVVAVTDISESEELFTVPRTTIITPSTSTLPQEISTQLDDPWSSLILTLIYEYQQRLESKWNCYIDILPSAFDSLMFWSEEQLTYLQGSAVVGKIGKEKADEMFTTKIIPVIKSNSETFKSQNLSDGDLVALCHRMGSTIMAYAFDLEKVSKDRQEREADDGWEEDSDDGAVVPIGMIPMADMLNANADLNNAKLFYEDDKVVMRSIKAITAGEEIYNDYGLVPNADLLRRYGYVTERYRKYDVVEISQALVKSVAKDTLKMADDEIQLRLEYLESELPVDAFDIAHQGAEDEQFPVELLAVLRCLSMTKVAFHKLKFKNKVPDTALDKEETDVLNLLSEIILRRGTEYRARDSKTLSPVPDWKDENARRQYMASIVVHGEQSVLEEAFNVVAGMLNPNKKRKLGFSEETSARRNDKKHKR